MTLKIREISYLLLAFCLLLSADTLQMQAKKKIRHKYKLVFHDEFNLPDGSQPDSSKWSRCKRYDSMWNRWISTSKDVIYIKGGRLVCRAIPNTKEKNDTAMMLTGAIESIKKFSFQYGRVDVRLKTNTLRGNFPAVWMKPEIIDPNNYGEIDIFESFANVNVAKQTVHNQLSIVQKTSSDKHKFNTKIQVNKWHIYSLEWTPDALVFLIDDEIRGVFQKSLNDNLLKQGQWTFDRPFYLILNQSVDDGRFDRLPIDTSHIYETQFDWIRVYKMI